MISLILRLLRDKFNKEIKTRLVEKKVPFQKLPIIFSFAIFYPC